MDLKDLIYDNSPIWVQNSLCSLKGFQENRLRFGKIFDQKLEFLLKSEWFSENEIQEFKRSEISRIIQYSFENIEYYNELFKNNKLLPSEIRSEIDLIKIPILTKEEVRKNYTKLINKNYKRSVKISKTSGSTGKSLIFNMSEDAINFRWAIWFRHRSRFGIKLHDKYATFTGLPAIPLKQSKPPYFRVNRPMNQTIFTMHHMSKDKVPSIVEKLNSEDFIYYSGYPSIIYNLALLIEDLNLQITNPPKVIFTGAENLYDNQRIKIAQIFKCTVTDQYGFSEGAGNASRCEHDLFHEDFEFGVLQCEQSIYNYDSHVTGEIIATGFANLAMPFIRYKVGDTATWTNHNDCKCGRVSKTLSSINGRNEDYVLTPEGNKILRFDYIFKDTPNIREAQIVQYNLNEIVIKISKRDQYNLSDEKKLIKEVYNKISPSLQVKFEYVDEIEKTATGKFRAVVSKL